ncbi:MAG TPA: sigma-70 family RNA polymerase sigma factor [Verrucomicrobiota bacterium]|nr:sigma-70 family RNA polymerase sigma factor [Verrucomicrobiota bacterium]
MKMGRGDNPRRASVGAAAMHEDDLFPTRRSLLSRLKNWDDQESWRDFFNTYWRLIYTAGRRAGLSESESEDLVQDTIVAVAKRMHDFKYDPATCAFKTWLRVLTQRGIANRYRKRGREVATVALPSRDDTSTEPIEALPDPAGLEPDPRWDEEWERNLLRAAIDRVQQRVAPVTFQVYDYHVLQGQTVTQTCKALGVSAGKVYMAKLRVGKMLKREVGELRRTLV